jgi:hypothetical protein
VLRLFIIRILNRDDLKVSWTMVGRRVVGKAYMHGIINSELICNELNPRLNHKAKTVYIENLKVRN